MNDWARTRKRIILSIVLTAIIILVGVPFYLLIYDKPTCADGQKNGDESGVDCGGSCQRLCNAESLPLILQGDPRVLAVASTTYEVVAIVNNPNQKAKALRAEYEIKVYDAASAIPAKIITGATFIPKGATFAVFEGPFTLQPEVRPSRATIEWKLNALSWTKDESAEPEIEINEVSLTNASSTPRLQAVVENLSLNQVSNLDFVALLSDSDGNLFAASKTFIDALPSGESAPIVFIWPRPFVKQAAQIQIIKRIFPDRSYIR